MILRCAVPVWLPKPWLTCLHRSLPSHLSTRVMDQIVNNAARLRYMSSGQFTAPIIIRAVTGGESELAGYSQGLDGWCATVPGLKVVVPLTRKTRWASVAPPRLTSDQPCGRRRRAMGDRGYAAKVGRCQPQRGIRVRGWASRRVVGAEVSAPLLRRLRGSAAARR